MNGIPLDTFKLDLHKVYPDCENPAQTILDWRQKIGHSMNRLIALYGKKFDFPQKYYQLPLEMLSGFSFDELCKLRHSSILEMHSTVRNLFETNPQYTVVHKIENCIWHWGSSSSSWNEIVDGYNSIRNFTFFDDPNFEIRLDHSAYTNSHGWSQYGDIFLDGAFAFLLYYKGVHAFTIGFSIASNQQLFIQQVQLAKRSGNRWLYKLPKNRLEFVLDRFRECFTDYTINVIDGGALAEKNLRDYRNSLEKKNEQLQYPHRYSPKRIASIKTERVELQQKISHLEGEKSRLANFYRDTGSYQLGGKPIIALGMPHYPVTLSI